jgi:hypothetical protein|tara:strand:+ start:283 stop:864 length:582 start_codon:yes stop_codon:yes gene_type:complete
MLIPKGEEMKKFKCDDCGMVGNEDEFPEAKDILLRMEVGGTYTDKECPECGALAYPVDKRMDGWSETLNLSDELKAELGKLRFDQLIEKHEGPHDWDMIFRIYNPAFILMDGQNVLLPVDESHHENISVLRMIWDDNEKSVVVFLKDTTYGDSWFDSGYVAICERVKDFYVASFYHEWFIVASFSEQYDTLAE